MTPVEQSMSIQVVHGGFILHYPEDSPNGLITKTEVFVNQGKLLKRIKEVTDHFSLLPRKGKDGE